MKLPVFRSWCAAGLAASCLWLTMTPAGRAAEPVVIGPIAPIAPVRPPVANAPDLTGKLTDFSIQSIASGTKIKLAGIVKLKNTGGEQAKGVAATVYVSSTPTLSPTEQPIAKLELASFRNGNGKVEPGDTVTIPLKYKLSRTLAAGLNGQYIIVVLSAADYSKVAIKFGPLKVP